MLLGKERTAPGTASKHRLLDDEAVGVGVSEQLQIAAGRLIYAPQCGLFYASLLTASIVEIVWISHPWVPSGYHWCVRTRTLSHESNAIASAPLTTALPLPHCSLVSHGKSFSSCHFSYPRSRVFMCIEAYLTCGLVAETTVTLLWQRGAFWASKSNWFDAIVCCMSILSFFL